MSLLVTSRMSFVDILSLIPIKPDLQVTSFKDSKR